MNQKDKEQVGEKQAGNFQQEQAGSLRYKCSQDMQAGSIQQEQAGSLRYKVKSPVKTSMMPEPAKMFDASEPVLASGSCVMRSPIIAEMVQNALLHFENDRYNLAAWCIMPNHVHVVVTPLGEYSLSSILHSWKSFTANKINKMLGRTGALWERESFDHLIRTTEDLSKFITYTEENPVKAGLCKDPQDWPFASCSAGFQPAPIQLIDPRKTPFVYPHGRGKLAHLEKPGGTYFVTFCLVDAVRKKRDTDRKKK